MSLFKHSAIQASPTIKDYNTKSDTHCRLECGLWVRGEFHKRTEDGKPLVSIITVVLNGDKNLEQTIQSVLNQTYDNIEYIIIDGGSTDGTLDIIKKYEDKIAYWISEPDKGIGDAWNKGIAVSSGEIIGILNADDWYEKDSVEHVVEQFLQSDAEIVYGNLQYWDGDSKAELFCADHRRLEIEMTINHPSVFVRREAYKHIGLFSTRYRYAVDYDWLLRAKYRGLRFHYTDRVLANMRLSGLSDRYWKQTEWEATKAKVAYSSNLLHYPYFLFKVFKGSGRRFLEHIHLGVIVKFYHARISRIKKKKVS